MKRYIKGGYNMDPWKNANLSEWSESDIELWNSTDWKARNYNSLIVLKDSFRDYLDIYGLPEDEDGDSVRHEKVTFVKEIRANTIFAPCYTVRPEDLEHVADKYRDMGYPIVGPMYDGTTVENEGVTYMVMDRCDTQELYDRLSR